MTDYPLHFDSCPNCGHKSTIIAEEVQLEKDAGRMSQKANVPIMQTRTAIFDQGRRSVLTIRSLAPAIIASYDVCSKCGTMYAIEVIKGQVELQAQGIPPTDNRIPPFRGQG